MAAAALRSSAKGARSCQGVDSRLAGKLTRCSCWSQQTNAWIEVLQKLHSTMYQPRSVWARIFRTSVAFCLLVYTLPSRHIVDSASSQYEQRGRYVIPHTSLNNTADSTREQERKSTSINRNQQKASKNPGSTTNLQALRSRPKLFSIRSPRRPSSNEPTPFFC